MKKIKKEIVEALNFYKNENKQGLSITAISNKFKIDKNTLKNHIESNIDIDTLIKFEDNYYLFDEDECKAIEEYINTDISFLGIRKKYGYKQETFKKKLEVLGYSTDRKYKLNYNRDRLKEIKTEEDAYILGFILADGYINKPHGMLRIKIQERDIDILEKICDYFDMDYSFIKYEYHSITGNKQYYLSIYDKNIILTLESYGIYQNKSQSEIPYTLLDENLIRHYIRGIWDGDGFIDKNGYAVGICGSEPVLTYIYNQLKKSLNLYPHKKSVMVRYDESSHIYRLAFSKKNAPIIIRYLYENSNIYLNRKYALYNKFKNNDIDVEK